ncbi:MAG: tRNA (N(6)-L-threonylcarbamoyladenosine(37)-C(2))-methylthiotransferase MtaB [Bacteroidales bacterium]|nr:tRNA (N(6)-L-threonylcarbamoyladenosine(37)-C(2))-methylthiotransferase MtaB [Bacteroidales bacterium]MBN2821517.1 tRNA (N(6)-L-threonylcarbamoyladenosine(37)-C(2))-methylthiotransferase MtaB [Bacteroidales bacterium]
MKRKVAFKTLGCRLNQFETDSIVTDFHKAGYEIVPFETDADVYVVNTCTVTNQSDQKSKNTINQAVRFAANKGLTVVTGCLVNSQKEILENRGDITYVVENKQKSSVFPLVDAHFKGEIVHPSDFKQDLFNFSVVEKGFHTRSMIKVQDGCNNFCTYCIVPKVRGRANSRPVKEVLENIKRVVDLGFKEVVLTGVNISRYNSGGLSFEDLVEKVLELPGDFRVRISSIEPEGFTRKFIELFENPKLSPHLHLCLQSGSDNVLERMRRFYSVKDFIELTEKFRKKFPLFNFTTDIIVGFPGEKEEDFKQSIEASKKIGFSHIHTFKYSVRKGTIAEKLPDQIPEKIKTERSSIIRNLAEDLKLEYRKQFIGLNQKLLVERPYGKSGARGYGEHYIPIALKGGAYERNTFVDVIIKEIADDKEKTVIAEPVQ